VAKISGVNGDVGSANLNRERSGVPRLCFPFGREPGPDVADLCSCRGVAALCWEAATSAEVELDKQHG
jgi:hypothetical protein